MDDIILRQEWGEWKQNKVTKEFLKRLFEKREGIKEELAEGRAAKEQLDQFIGQCQAYKDAIDYGIRDFEVVETEEKD